MTEEGRHDREEPLGLNDAYAINLKRLIARELDHDRDQQQQAHRIIEQTIAMQARINEIAMQSLQAFTNSMDERQKDSRMIAVRKEHKAEERAEELEETLNKNVTSSNEVISGIVSLLEAAGVLGASQQTSGKIRSRD